MKFMAAMMLPALLLISSASGEERVKKDVPPGAVSEESLGEMLRAIGLKPVKTDKRYDFAFKTSIRGEEWKFSMSSVLSRNGESVWVMAWLDQIPSHAAEVPRTALLRLLAANDRMGNGKFFAYIPTNKRFVMQRVLKNERMNKRVLMETLHDLSVSVAEEYPIWTVSNWAPKDAQSPKIAGKGSSEGDVPLPNRTNANQSPNTQTSEANTKFGERRVQ